MSLSAGPRCPAYRTAQPFADSADRIIGVALRDVAYKSPDLAQGTFVSHIYAAMMSQVPASDFLMLGFPYAHDGRRLGVFMKTEVG